MIDFERKARKPRSVNVISIIDVMLVLLIFFMLAGSVKAIEVLPVDLPVAETTAKKDQGQIVISLGRYEEIVVNDELLADGNELKEWVANYMKDKPNAEITVKADSRMKAEELIDAMKLIEQAGGKTVILATQEM
ncbi:MAG: biopolymer transporter ExbD [Rickettsiales bacterium]